MDDLVSIVIPVYNVENYLDRCLNSIVNQTYPNLEIILVDDGSTDSCPELCEKWAERDKRIKVIHKENAGLGMARNTGIDNATGQYICFFDSDDYVDLSTIELAYALSQKESADIVIFGLEQINQDGKVIARAVPNMPQTVYCGEDVQKYILADIMGSNPKTGNITNLPRSACTCLFSMQMVNRINWRFASEREIISEDTYSLLMLYKYVNKVAIIQKALYYYYVNNNSLTHSYQPDRFERVKNFYNKCIELCKSHEYSPEIERRCLGAFLGNTIAAMKQEVAFHDNKVEALDGLRKITDDALLQWSLQEKRKDKVRLKIRILFWAIRHKHYYLCYILLSAQNASRYK